MTESEIVRAIARSFRTFGKGGNVNTSNPISVALQDQALTFAAGVDVVEVVRFVMERCKE